MEKSETWGFVILFIGICLLAFTFFNAYFFLRGEISIIASADLIEAFGEVLAVLVETIIHLIYLGVMGWIASVITMRGIQLATMTRKEAKIETKKEEN